MILGVIAKCITFPGALVQALWEHILCRVYEVPVEDARYLRGDELCGHVEHEMPQSAAKRFFLCFVPFLFNLILGVVFAFPAAASIFWAGQYTQAEGLANILMLWLGVSFLTNLFPSVEDALALWDAFYKRDGGIHMIGKVLLAPITAVLFAGAYLAKYGAALLTAILTAVFLPYVGYLFV